MKIANNKIFDLKQWIQFTLLFILFFAFNNAYAQYEEHECFIDTTSQDTSELAFVSSIYGKNFTPKGEFRIILVFAGFTNDNNKIGGYNPNTGDTTYTTWPYYDMNGDSLNTFPTNVDDYFYSNYNQFSPSNNDKTISNYFYQMSLPNGTPLKMVADVFPERINVTADIALDTSGQAGWGTYNQWVLDSIATNHPNFDWSPYDNRKNNPGNSFDNSDVINHPPDSIIDFLVILWRYGKDCPNDPNYINPITQQPYSSTLCKNPHSNVAVADIPHNKTFTDSLGRTYKTTHLGGFRVHKALHGINRSLFLHEVAHNLYGSPHYNGANGVVGSQFYNNFGFGMMKPGNGPHVYESANGWERWHLGWIELTTDSNQVNTQLDSIGDIQNGGIYTLRDFITTGDVVRVRIPQPYGEDQYLWLENHQGKSTFDNREGWLLNGVNDTFPDAPRGLVAYVEKMGSRNFNLFYSNRNKVNGIKYLNNNGHYDYTNQYADPEPSAPEVWGGITYNFIRGAENPLSPHTSTSYIRNDFIPNNNKIDYHNNWNNNTYNNIQNEHRFVYKEDGSFTYGALGIGMTFNQGDKIGLSSNPVITNIQWFQQSSDTLSSIYLTGISFEVLSYNQDSSVTVKIRMDDYDVDNSTRYTGNIILSPNIVSSNNYSLNIKAGKTLTIDKSGTPNKQHITANNDFINPTVFICSGGSYFHLEQNAKVEVKNESTLRLKSGSKMEIENGARLEIHNGSSLIIEDGAELILNPGGVLTIAEGATVYYNNNQSGKGLLVGATSISGNAARVEVIGNMVFDANAVWTHNRDGYYYFFPNHQLTMPSTVVMNFSGKGKNHQMISLFANTTLLLENITATLNTGMIYYNSNSSIQLNQVDFTSVASTYNPAINFLFTGIGLNITNPTDVFINGCDFNYLATGIKIEQAATPLTVQATNMTGMADYNYYIDDVEEISITGGILDGGDYGIVAINTEVLEVTNTEIKNMQTSGANLDEVAGAYFSNTKIYTNTNGIYSDNSLVFLRNGAKVYDNQDYGLDMYGVYNTQTKSFSSMLTIGDEGCGSVFDNVTTGIKTKNTLLNIDAVQHTIDRQDNDTIPNQFYDNGHMFDICYSYLVRSPSKINAKGNYWGSNPPIQSSEYTIVANYCPGDASTPQNLPLDSDDYSTCYSSTTCMDCSAGTSSMMMSGGTSTVESVIQESFTEANQPFIEQDNATTRNAFLDLSSIDIIKDTVNDTWMGVSVNNQTFVLTNKSVHHIQVAKAIKAKATNSNMRVNAVPKDIFAGITENANELANIQVYPNPVSNELNISHDLSVKEGAVHFEIMDVMGRVLINTTINNTNNQIGISQLSRGLYFYNVLQNDKVVQSGKLVVE